MGDRGSKVIPLSTSSSPEDANLGEAFVPCLFTTHLAAWQSLSPSPHAPVFLPWKHVSPPAWQCPWASRHPTAHRGHPRDPVLDREVVKI
jgi:hypothetical protein